MSTPDVLILNVAKSLANDYAALERELKKAGIRVEIYGGEDKIGKQFKYADQSHVSIVLVLGMHEKETGTIKLKDMRRPDVSSTSANERVVPRERAIIEIRARLSN
jgi:histidyl-tRNA synthetase